jgi:hypothetical protein
MYAVPQYLHFSASGSFAAPQTEQDSISNLSQQLAEIHSGGVSANAMVPAIRAG